MAEHSIELPGAGRQAGFWRLAKAIVLSGKLEAGTAVALAFFTMSLMVRHFWLDEGMPANILFTLGVTAALVSMVLLATGRLLFSAVVVGAFVAILLATSAAKHSTMNMVVHAYDLIFYLGSQSTISYLWNDQRRYIVGFAIALALSAALSAIVFRADTSRVPRRWSAAALVLAVVAASVGALTKGERRHMQFYFQNLYVSSFYASWGETVETLMRGALLEAAPRTAKAAGLFLPANGCTTGAKPPHIILIHEESVVQPSLFPTLRYDHSIDPLFLSQDGALHKMRVETYGGASWLTEFSILAGVSTQSFGGMRQFVQTFTQDKLKDTLPQTLEACGYRNVVFYPMMRNFVSNDRFYTSIGLKEIFDLKTQGAKSAQERDRFYYDNAVAEIDRHLKGSRKPLFAYIQTMSAHWPYDFKFEPDADVPGGAPGTNPEMHEYLRRLSLAKVDLEHLLAELKKRFPRESFLVVHYGDHHPTATRTLLGFGEEVEAEDVALAPESTGFITYYAARGVNYRVRPMPPFEVLDVPYLGTVILDLAGLPLPASHEERKKLMLLCKGRYFSCPQREQVLQFHRRLIDSGLISAR